MSYIFGKLWHLAIIWAIRKAFQCILQGIRFLLAKQTRLSPTSENDSYTDWEYIRVCSLSTYADISVTLSVNGNDIFLYQLNSFSNSPFQLLPFVQRLLLSAPSQAFVPARSLSRYLNISHYERGTCAQKVFNI